jgi:FkbM family methyltransferase
MTYHIQTLKTGLTVLGLKPLALRLYFRYLDLVSRMKPRFRLVVHGAEVVFVTEETRSRWFFHHRYRSGQWHEPAVTEQLAALVRDARSFADVGAHLGYYGCVAGALNRQIRLYLFEMNRELVGIIERNLKANRLGHHELVNAPVADRRKPVAYPGGTTKPGLSIRPATEDQQDDRMVVAEAVALDEFFATRGDLPDVIKIDVQGAELDVLRGAAGILERHHPALLLEVHPSLIGNFGGTVTELYELLARHGYQLRRFTDHRGERAGLIDVRKPRDLPEHTHMLLCV